MRARLLAIAGRHADAVIAALCFLAVAAAAAWFPSWQSLERKVFDELTVRTANGELTQPLVLVAIDEESLAELKMRWPWPRSLHAQVVERMARGGAAVIGIDLLFAEPSEAAEDAALAQAIRKAGNVVLAADFTHFESGLLRVWKRVEPLQAFTEAGALAGLATIPLDPDSFMRRIPDEADAFWRQIVKVVQVKAPSVKVPSLPEEGALIRYLGPDTVFDPIPYHLVLKASPEELKAVFDGRIAIIGRDVRAAPELGLAQSDLFATPFLERSGTLTAGMKVHATMVDNALSGTWLRALALPGNLAVTAAATLFAFLGMRRWRPLRATLALLGIAACLGAISGYAFVHQRTWMAVATPLGAALLAYLAFGVRAYLEEQRRKRELQQAFSLYLPPELVDQIAADPKKLELGGESREITVIFTDLAGFTKLTEKHPPPVVQQVLFRHFTAMTEVVHSHKGAVVQFIGDAIMAFWSAPLHDPEHALHAVQAAIGMQREMERLRAALRAEGLPEIHMRIGVNTCTAIVGNMGSRKRLAYTAMGDGVNEAARLEGANKFWKTPILVSGDTAAKLGGRVPLRRVDRIKVSGKTEAADVYTPSEDADLNRRTDAAFEAYLKQDWETAERAYAAMLEANPEDGVARRLLERIRAWAVDPALASADGSIALEKL
jgi:adenylate cyclase